MADSITFNRVDPGRPAQAPGDRYKKIIGDEDKMDRLLVELFLQTHDTPPEDIWVELDATDNSAHCDQELIGCQG